MRAKLEKLFDKFDRDGRDIPGTVKEALLLIADEIGVPPEIPAPPPDQAAEDKSAPEKAAAKKGRAANH